MSSGQQPTVTAFAVYPVAGRDSMELNLSGAHGPYFTRNVVVLTDSEGRTGLGEVPGGEKITRTLRDAESLVVLSEERLTQVTEPMERLTLFMRIAELSEIKLRDFEQAHHTAQGAYLVLRMKFDQETFGLQEAGK